MTYYITFAVNARYIAQVEADNLKEAQKLAWDEYYSANLNELEDVEGKQIIVEDEDGNYLYES